MSGRARRCFSGGKIRLKHFKKAADERVYCTGTGKNQSALSMQRRGLTVRTGKKDIFEKAGFKGASGKNTFTPLSKDNYGDGLFVWYQAALRKGSKRQG